MSIFAAIELLLKTLPLKCKIKKCITRLQLSENATTKKSIKKPLKNG